MAELTFKSPGVSTREIDLSGPTNVTPTGVPAGIIGTALTGPAFVPITVGTFQDFVAIFGETDGKKFGPLAVSEWLRNANAATYIRVLGAGDGTARTTSGNNTGKVNSAGFVVGDEQIQDSGLISRNVSAVDAGPPGRTHFLGCFMSESAGSTIFQDAGIVAAGSNKAHPIIRGIIFAASGVVPTLSGNLAPSTAPDGVTAATAAGPSGGITGSLNLSSGKQEFVLLLNGHIPTAQNPAVVTASFDVDSKNYFANVLNMDPLKLEDAGHVLYTHYDIHPALAVPTGSGIYNSTETFGATGVENAVFITTGSLGRNAGSSTIPNFESFEDRFAAAESPYVISQKFGGNPQNLFKIHALSDGETSSARFKISIRNIAKSTSDRYEYGTFDLLVRDWNDTDTDPVVLEQFSRLSLDPSNDRFIAKIIGDQHFFFDFDKNEDGQKLVLDGSYPNASRYIRVEIPSKVENGEVDATALPVGFRGPKHLVTSGSGILTAVPDDAAHVAGEGAAIQRAVVPPVPLREAIVLGTGDKVELDRQRYWGVQFERKVSVTEPNKSLVPDETLESFTKYFPTYHTTNQNPWVGDNAGAPDADGTVYDSDRFNRNSFSLENIRVVTGSNGVADPKEWTSAAYVRAGGIVADDSAKTRALSVADDFADATVRSLAKFSFYIQGGFDGVRIFNRETRDITNTAVVREIGDTAQGTNNGPTVKSYAKALDIMSERSDVQIKLLAIPGIRDSSVTDLAIQKVEERFDALYIMDVEERDVYDAVITGSNQEISVKNTANAHANRGLDTSFGAAYFPDTYMRDRLANITIQVPPSVSVLGAMALNDRIAYPWFAPAGFTRGALDTVEETAVRLSRPNLDALYDVDINPIASFPGSGGPVVWGQKTLQQIQSALDRVNVRRLLIEIRREVRQVANRFVFEPNREETLTKFEGQVRPILSRIQSQQGVERFRVRIDTTTTTQADVENNTIRGQVIIQPTRSIEFVSIDFVVSNTGIDV
jgi:phage tail sheath protein FI